MKLIFKLLALINKTVLPKYYKRDLNKLKKWQKAIIAYRYYVTIKSLD